MGLEPAEKATLINAINETAAAIDDRVNATTAAAKLAAKNRYAAGMKALLIGFANTFKHGTSGDFSD